MSDSKIASFTSLAARWCGGTMLRRFARREEGAAAVEFALVAAPFLAMVFAIIQTAFMFFAGQALETAAADSARLIMTGQAQMQGYNEARFKQEVCAKVVALFDCSGGLYVDVKSYPSFAAANVSKPVDSSGNLQTADFGYRPGGPGDIVIVRLIYQWPVYVSLLGFNLSDTTGGNRLLMATVAFCNEPYGGASSSCG